MFLWADIAYTYATYTHIHTRAHVHRHARMNSHTYVDLVALCPQILFSSRASFLWPFLPQKQKISAIPELQSETTQVGAPPRILGTWIKRWRGGDGWWRRKDWNGVLHVLSALSRLFTTWPDLDHLCRSVHLWLKHRSVIISSCYV